METIRVVLDAKLLEETCRAARRTKRNRSALIRDVLREHLWRHETVAQEESDRRGYARLPPAPDVAPAWEGEAACAAG